jgi:hypothetical protein
MQPRTRKQQRCGAGERSQEKVFRDWITSCHKDLDKVTRFEKLAGPELQASLFSLHTPC